jgi:hypothetical protein
LYFVGIKKSYQKHEELKEYINNYVVNTSSNICS